MSAEARVFECVFCGATASFSPGEAFKTCTCGQEIPLPEVFDDAVPELPVDAPDRDEEGRELMWCSGCGVFLSAPGKTLAACTFCGVGLRPAAEGTTARAPQGYLPFVVDEDACRTLLRTKLSALQISDEVQTCTRVFVPWWLVTYDVRATYEGQRGMVHKSGNSSTVRWVATGGEVERKFENIRACGSKHVSADAAARLRPWDWAFTRPYEPGVTGDAVIEHSVLGAEEGFRLVMPDISGDIENAIKFEIGGHRQKVESVQRREETCTIRVVLLPLWTTRLAGSGAGVLINGRTGEVLVEGSERANPESDGLLDTMPPDRTKMVVGIVAGVVLFIIVVWAGIAGS